MNSKKVRVYSISLLLASMLLFASASLYAYYQFEMIGKILKAGLVDPLEAWSEASYIVWPCNSTHYAARNMSTLLVDFGPSTNASEVIENTVAYPFQGTVFFKIGTYSLDSTINISGNRRVDFIGEGMEATILSFAGDIDGLIYDTMYQSRIANLALKGDNSTVDWGLKILNAQNIEVENVLLDLWSDGTTGGAVKIENSYDCTFINVRHHRSRIGLSIGAQVNNNVWLGCRFKSNWNHGMLHSSSDSNGNTFINGDFADNAVVGAQIDDGLAKILFTACWFESNALYGLRVRSTGGGITRNMKIEDSFFTANPDHLVLPYTNKTVIDNNAFGGGNVALTLYNTTYDATISNNEHDGDPATFISDSGSVNTTYFANKGYTNNVALIKTGNYTGDGTVSQAITGIGFAPIKVIVYVIPPYVTNWGPVMKTTEMPSDWCINLSGGEDYQNMLISLDTDGFTVDDGGADARPNTNGEAYGYIAYG